MWCAACGLPVTGDFSRRTCTCADAVLTSEPQGGPGPAVVRHTMLEEANDYSGVVKAVSEAGRPWVRGAVPDASPYIAGPAIGTRSAMVPMLVPPFDRAVHLHSGTVLPDYAMRFTPVEHPNCRSVMYADFKGRSIGDQLKMLQDAIKGRP